MDIRRITEVGIVEVHRGRLIREWSTLVNPGMSIPPAIQALTGISNDMVALAPTFADIQRAIAVLMWPKTGDGKLKPPERLSPDEVKRRLREWLKSENDK